MKIILASASERRRELLNKMGWEFEVLPSGKEEKITKEEPWEAVMELAQQKATDIAGQIREEALVIGADTIVVRNGRFMGKPKDKKEAEQMIRELSGAAHQVYTGVCLIRAGNGTPEKKTFYEKTDVLFYPMTEQEIRDYIATEEPFDKAGAYAIQGTCAKYIKGISGDYNNVVGLPVARLYQELKTWAFRN